MSHLSIEKYKVVAATDIYEAKFNSSSFLHGSFLIAKELVIFNYVCHSYRKNKYGTFYDVYMNIHHSNEDVGKRKSF